MNFHGTTLTSSSLIPPLALLAALALTTFSGSAAAGPLPELSGWGERGNSSFIGSIVEQADGSLTGYFTIIIQPSGEDPEVCRYERFSPNAVTGGSWDFDGEGTCLGPYGEFPASNRFVIVDNGSPGAGVDSIDVNYYGATGVSIPGGLFDDGDITYTP